MDARSFQLNVSVPADGRYAEPVRDLAAHAARYAGCGDAAADAYGGAVEAAVRACMSGASGGSVGVIVRRGDGPVECLIACERPFEHGPTRDRHITVDWTEHAGRQVCRVALAIPMRT